MIAKISDPFKSGIDRKISYQLGKIEAGKADFLFSNLDTDMENISEEMKSFSEMNSRVKLPYIEIVLSLENGEKIDDDTFSKLANEYMQRMGYDDCSYAVIRNSDTDNPHVHILATTISMSGKHISDSNIRRKSYNLSRELEEKYNLRRMKEKKFAKQTLGEVHHRRYYYDAALKKALRSKNINKRIGEMLNKSDMFKNMNYSEKQSFTNKEWEIMLGTPLYEDIGEVLSNGRFFNTLMKDELLDALDSAYLGSANTREFRSKLEGKGIYMRMVSNKGKSYYVYGISDQSYYVKDTSLPKKYRFGEISFDYGNISPDEQKHLIYCQVKAMLNTSKDYEDFKERMKANNIDIKEYKNNTGIYGLSFSINNISEATEFKASDISRQLTYKNIQAYFDREKTEWKGNVFEPVKEESNYNRDMAYMLAGVNAIRGISTGGIRKHKEDEDEPKKKRKKEHGR
jgi:hypothetical protein